MHLQHHLKLMATLMVENVKTKVAFDHQKLVECLEKKVCFNKKLYIYVSNLVLIRYSRDFKKKICGDKKKKIGKEKRKQIKLEGEFTEESGSYKAADLSSHDSSHVISDFGGRGYVKHL